MAHRHRPFRASRRRFIASGAALAGLAVAGVRPAAATATGPLHGLSIFGDLKYPADFAHFDYVNADAPKGGRLSRIASSWAYNQNPTTFNTLNTLVMKGDAPVALDIIYDSLMVRALDEPDAVYGLLAQSVEIDASGRVYRFTLRPQARFHDGSALTAADAAFTLETLKQRGHALIRQTIRRMQSAVAEDEHTLAVTLQEGAPRSLAIAIATLPILSSTFYQSHDFEEAGFTRPLGSGPYRVGAFEAGRYIEYERVRDYWGRDLPVNRGRHNFDVIRYEFFRDRTSPSKRSRRAPTTCARSSPRACGRADTTFPRQGTGACAARRCRTSALPARRAGSSTPGARSSRTRACARRSSMPSTSSGPTRPCSTAPTSAAEATSRIPT